MIKYVCKICGYIYDPPRAIRITALRRVPRSRTCRRTGYARCARSARMNLSRHKRTGAETGRFGGPFVNRLKIAASVTCFGRGRLLYYA